MMDLCPHCNDSALLVNGVDPQGRISYVCRNPRCPMYLQAFYATGTEAETLVKEREVKDA